MPTISVNGIELYYERAGHGPRVLFLNGSGSTLAMVAPLIEVFAGRLDVVAYDQRGLGRELPSPPAPTRWPTMPPTRSGSSTASGGPRVASWA